MNNDTNRAIGVLDRIATEQGDDAAIDAATSNLVASVVWLRERLGPSKVQAALVAAGHALWREP